MITFDQALCALRAGQVVALPTDTVYGLAASLESPAAIEAIYLLKERPETMALPVLVSEYEQISAMGITLQPEDYAVLNEVWPGDFTVILPAPEAISQLVGGRNGTVAIRIPGDPLVLELLAESGPLAVTSANKHGEPTPTTAEGVDAIFVGESNFAGTLDGGVRSSQPSAIMDMSEDPWRIVRQGRLSDAEAKGLTQKP